MGASVLRGPKCNACALSCFCSESRREGWVSWHTQLGGDGTANAPQAVLEMGHDTGAVSCRDRVSPRGGTLFFKS